jgi:hypothetical protein
MLCRALQVCSGARPRSSTGPGHPASCRTFAVRLAEWVPPVGGALTEWVPHAPVGGAPRRRISTSERRQLGSGVQYTVYRRQGQIAAGHWGPTGEVVPRSRCQASAKQVPSKCQASAKQMSSRYRGRRQAARRGDAKQQAASSQWQPGDRDRRCAGRQKRARTGAEGRRQALWRRQAL